MEGPLLLLFVVTRSILRFLEGLTTGVANAGLVSKLSLVVVSPGKIKVSVRRCR